MEKQTSVNWLIKRIENLITIETFEDWIRIKEIAKVLEKDQIKEAYEQGEWNDGMNGDAEEYYNQTFKK